MKVIEPVNYSNGFDLVVQELQSKQNQAVFTSYNKLKKFDGKEGTTVLPIWSQYDHLKFEGSPKIHCAEDVAFLMRALENKNIEHSFAIHVNQDKEPFLQFVGMGGKAAVMFDIDIVMAGAEVFNPEKIYYVHNHPTGSLSPSEADIRLTKLAKEGFGKIGIDVEHIIVNTYKNYFTVIDTDQRYNKSHSHPRPFEIENAVPIKAFLFDGTKTLMEPIAQVKSSRDAAETIQKFRFSALPKIGLLPLNSSLEVLGNFILPKINVRNIAELVSKLPQTKNFILYGNQSIKNISSIKDALGNFNIELLDYIQVDSNSPSVIEAYKSYADENLLEEVKEKYGTSFLASHEFNESKTIKR